MWRSVDTESIFVCLLELQSADSIPDEMVSANTFKLHQFVAKVRWTVAASIHSVDVCEKTKLRKSNANGTTCEKSEKRAKTTAKLIKMRDVEERNRYMNTHTITICGSCERKTRTHEWNQNENSVKLGRNTIRANKLVWRVKYFWRSDEVNHFARAKIEKIREREKHTSTTRTSTRMQICV